jgi:hypothetical protein
MKRISKILLLCALFGLKVWMEQPEIEQKNDEIGRHFEPLEWVQLIGDTGSFHFELKLNAENLTIKTVHPAKEKPRAQNA